MTAEIDQPAAVLIDGMVKPRGEGRERIGLVPAQSLPREIVDSGIVH